MATLKAANVTKYDAGGSGDNIVADGFIKTVEKVWIDSYAITAAIPSSSSLLIGRVPANKKITDIVVYMPVISAAGTATTVYCGTGATTSTSQYFGILQNEAGVAAQTNTFDGGTTATIRLAANDTNKMQALGSDTGIYITISPATTITGGTIRSIVKYT
uniref:Uncharacterized protein n=1 Tax=viral metagenome TaxID=1070528 RepID=A0A6M3IQ16_9ZZZZ